MLHSRALEIFYADRFSKDIILWNNKKTREIKEYTDECISVILW